MAQVYNPDFRIVETQNTGKDQLHKDAAGNVIAYNDSSLALDAAKSNYANGKYKVFQEMKVDKTDAFDISG